MSIMHSIFSILSNEQLSVLENIVIWLNMIGATFAVYYNYQASSMGVPKLRLIHFLVAGFAAVYVTGYLFLLLCDPAFLLWSAWFRGISLFVWFIVWIGPAYTSSQIWQDLEKKVKEIEEEIEEVE